MSKQRLTVDQTRDYVKSGKAFRDFLTWLRKPHLSSAGVKGIAGSLLQSPLDLFLSSAVTLEEYDRTLFKVSNGHLTATGNIGGNYEFVCSVPEWMDRYNYDLSKIVRQGNISFITALHQAEKVERSLKRANEFMGRFPKGIV